MFRLAASYLTASALGVAVLASSCISSQPTSRGSSTPTNSVLVAYRSAVDRAWEPLYRHGNTWSNHCGTGLGGVDDTIGNARLCRADSVEMKTDVQSAQDLLAAVATEPELLDRDQALKQMLGEMPRQFDLLIASIDASDIQAEHAPKLRISALWRDSWFTVSAIDCWPKGIQRNGPEANTAFSCV